MLVREQFALSMGHQPLYDHAPDKCLRVSSTALLSLLLNDLEEEDPDTQLKPCRPLYTLTVTFSSGVAVGSLSDGFIIPYNVLLTLC